MRKLPLTCLLLLSLPALARSDDTLVLNRIAFGSCARQDRPLPIWESIVASKPQLFLSLGDNIYADTKDMKVMKAKYDLLAAHPGYQKLLKTCPLLATWDDHDYGANDAGADFPAKDESQQLFLDFFGIPRDSPRRTQKGVYNSAVFGPFDRRVQVILLDTRYFRSPLRKRPGKIIPSEGAYEANTDPAATILGEAQWKWLAEQLQVPAKLRLLVSSIQVVPQDHHHEKWMNFPHERDRLYKLLQDTKAAGVVILSGDRHLAELSVMDAGLGYPLFDLTSSGLNQGSPKWRKLEVNRHRIATMNWGNNFGVIGIDWDRPDPLLRLQIRDEAGDVMIQEKVPLSLLQPGAVKSKAAGTVAAVKLNGAPLTAELLEKHLKKEVTLEMKVAATGASTTGGLVFLNSHADRSDADNFTVVLDKKAQAALKQAGIATPRTHFEGKTVRVTGELSLFRDRPQIIVSDAKQIEVVP
jgi:alkaline phosphatase D